MTSAVCLSLLPGLPLLGAALIVVAGPRIRSLAGPLATFFVALALVLAGALAPAAWRGGVTVELWSFFASPALKLPFAWRWDPLAAVMAFTVLGMSAVIHFYSIGSMAHDPSRRRYFACLNFFVSAMLTLVIADSLPVLFIGWEGVGLASYLLIGFWHERPLPRAAALKAFLVNRVGDLGFLLGLAILALLTGSASLADIAAKFSAFPGENLGRLGLLDYRVHVLCFPIRLLDLTALLFFLAAAAKSAQFPLHLWLPDAMAGPTPVSALIHSATMVTAGVFLVVRLQPLFAVAPLARNVMLAVSLFTAIAASLVALTQFDLKRLLAWSTIAQLAFMMAAAAIGESGAAVFHLVTHAGMKALLFLAAGAVMHSLANESDLRRLGGLARFMPGTAGALVVGALALAGVPPFAGAWSKHRILVSLWHVHPLAGLAFFLVALLGALYCGRLVKLAVLGDHRGDPGVRTAGRDPGLLMLAPLALLALFTLVAGFLPVPEWLGAHELPPGRGHGFPLFLLHAAPLVFFVIGLWWPPLARLDEGGRVITWIRSGFGYDALVARLVVAPFVRLARWTREVFDAGVVDDFIAWVAGLVRSAAESMRAFQTGDLALTLLYITIAVTAMMWLVLP